MVNKQDYLNAITQNIDMVRGDTLAFNFQLSGLGSREAYEELNVRFAVAEDYNAAPEIEATTGDGIELLDYTGDVATFGVCLSPYMTEDMTPARYVYDLQINDETNVVTLMRGVLTLLYEVAR